MKVTVFTSKDPFVTPEELYEKEYSSVLWQTNRKLLGNNYVEDCVSDAFIYTLEQFYKAKIANPLYLKFYVLTAAQRNIYKYNNVEMVSVDFCEELEDNIEVIQYDKQEEQYSIVLKAAEDEGISELQLRDGLYKKFYKEKSLKKKQEEDSTISKFIKEKRKELVVVPDREARKEAKRRNRELLIEESGVVRTRRVRRNCDYKRDWRKYAKKKYVYKQPVVEAPQQDYERFNSDKVIKVKNGIYGKYVESRVVKYLDESNIEMYMVNATVQKEDGKTGSKIFHVKTIQEAQQIKRDYAWVKDPEGRKKSNSTNKIDYLIYMIYSHGKVRYQYRAGSSARLQGKTGRVFDTLEEARQYRDSK